MIPVLVKTSENANALKPRRRPLRSETSRSIQSNESLKSRSFRLPIESQAAHRTMPQRNVYYIIVVALISLFLASRTTFKEQLVREIVQLVRRSSLYSPSQNDVIEGALDGVAASVNDEPYTDYLPPLKQTEYLRDMHGQYAGVGLSNFVKDQESGEFYFVPFRNTPAARASLKFGDRIVAVDEADKLSFCFRQAVVSRIR